MRRLWPVLLGLSLAAGGAAFVASRAIPGERSTAATASSVAEETRGRMAPPRPEPAARAVDGFELQPALGDREGAREETPGVPLLEVLVVEAESGAPRAGALVRRVLMEELGGALFWRALESEDPSDLSYLEGHGTERATDGAGLARFPLHARTAFFAATDGDWWGVSKATARDAPVVIRMRRRAGLLVRVLDAAGRPAVLVPIALSGVDSSPPGGLPAAITGERGEARVASWPEFAAFYEGTHAELFVGAAIPAREPIWARISVDRDPDEPVEIRLPPAGSVLVRVPGAGGNGGVVTLRQLAGSGPSAALAALPSACIESATARFPFVDLGLELLAEAELDGTVGRPLRRFSGPTSAGESVEVWVEVLAQPLLAGRVMEAGPTPSAREPLSFRLGPGWSIGDARLPLDEEGRFRIALTGPGEAESEWLRLRSRGDGSGPGGELLVELPSPLTPGVHDLGDLRLAAPRPVAEGLVVDSRGAPIEGAEVQGNYYLAAREPAEGGAGSFELDFEALATTGKDGRFRILASEVAQRWRITAHAGVAYWPAALEVEHGAEGVRLELIEAGSLESSWILPESLGSEAFTIRLGGGDAALSDLRKHIVGLGERRIRGTFGPLPAGAYRISFLLSGGGAEVLSVDGITVLPGAPTRDPRAADIDLSPHVDIVRLSIEGEDGKPLAVRPEARVSDGRSFSAARLAGEGPVYALGTPKGMPLDVLVRARGFCVARIPAAIGEVSIRLRPSFTVRLRVGPAPLLERDGRWLVVHPRRIGDPIESSAFRSMPLAVGEDGEVPFEVDWPGSYRFTLGWSGPGSGGSADRWVEAPEEHLLEPAMDGALLHLTAPAELFEE